MVKSASVLTKKEADNKILISNSLAYVLSQVFKQVEDASENAFASASGFESYRINKICNGKVKKLPKRVAMHLIVYFDLNTDYNFEEKTIEQTMLKRICLGVLSNINVEYREKILFWINESKRLATIKPNVNRNGNACFKESNYQLTIFLTNVVFDDDYKELLKM